MDIFDFYYFSRGRNDNGITMKKLLITLAFLLLLVPFPAHAHPHLFITPAVSFIQDKGAIKAVRISWIWDEFWSEEVMFDCDLDGNGSLSVSEIKLVKKDFFDGVQDFNYFFMMKSDGKKIKFGAAKNFTVKTADGNRLIYEFTLESSNPVIPKNKLELFFFDKTIYTAFEESIEIVGGKHPLRKITFEPYSDYGVKMTLSR